MTRNLIKLVPLCLLAIPALTGCESDRGSSTASDQTDFWVEPSDTEIVAGEIVTFTAHSRDLVGRDAKIEWSATAGDVKTEQNGRIARVTFEEPGAYTVTGRLLLDGRTVHEDSIDIEVEPLSS